MVGKSSYVEVARKYLSGAEGSREGANNGLSDDPTLLTETMQGEGGIEIRPPHEDGGQIIHALISVHCVSQSKVPTLLPRKLTYAPRRPTKLDSAHICVLFPGTQS